MRVADGGDGTVARLDLARKPVVEVAPSAAGLLVFFHVVWGRVPEALDLLDGFGVVQPLAQFFGVAIQPIREPGFLDVDGARLNRVLELLDRGLVHEEVEEADAIVDFSSMLVLLGDPVEPFIDLVEVLACCGNGLR